MLAPTVMVIVELPEPGAGIVCGLKLTVVPEGMPEADRLMALLKPPLMVVVIVEVLIALLNGERGGRSGKREVGLLLRSPSASPWWCAAIRRHCPSR